MRLRKERADEPPNRLWGKRTKEPTNEKPQEKLPPRPPNVLTSQSIGAIALRLLLGLIVGFLLRAIFPIPKIHFTGFR